jgi:hypothetical protein
MCKISCEHTLDYTLNQQRTTSDLNVVSVQRVAHSSGLRPLKRGMHALDHGLGHALIFAWSHLLCMDWSAYFHWGNIRWKLCNFRVNRLNTLIITASIEMALWSRLPDQVAVNSWFYLSPFDVLEPVQGVAIDVWWLYDDGGLTMSGLRLGQSGNAGPWVVPFKAK